jgi:hypothetical protein
MKAPGTLATPILNQAVSDERWAHPAADGALVKLNRTFPRFEIDFQKKQIIGKNSRLRTVPFWALEDNHREKRPAPSTSAADIAIS